MSASVEKGEIVGGIVLAFGSAIAAFGDTLLAKTDNPALKRKGIEAVTYGSLIEGTGNFIQTFSRLKANPNIIQIETIGAGVQGIGNIINTFGGFILLDDQEIRGLQLDFIGDGVQAIGASLEAIGALQSDYYYGSILAIGEAFQAYGAAIEAYGNVLLLCKQKEEGERIQAFGSQLLFIGTVISVEALAWEFKIQEVTF
ncbi:DUF6944 family repetitive protein [Mangrovibacillus cuniculi]|uniref:Uncharacterized protein n=1 Tax=Mangrovibacillus cuniculi TaxID=2593652 RepID=A0A7S8CDQ4_9BACI|nr:hypothetical protein [Mangrovibacillus cuniculi]QPC48107.1 hypothetical protein G8O30_14805 [Mangrovibacillus cuniculi]